MTLTGQQVEDDIYALLQGSSLKTVIGGKVYRYDMRPRNSTAEDAIVKFVAGLDGDVQTGVVVVNIYVPDVDAYKDGVMRRNVARCRAVEVKANEWVKSLTAGTTDYLFELAQTIYTEEEAAIAQHFVSIRIKFKILTS
jgi:hypothetical protein